VRVGRDKKVARRRGGTGREGGREGGKEGGREGGKEGRREGGRVGCAAPISFSITTPSSVTAVPPGVTTAPMACRAEERDVVLSSGAPTQPVFAPSFPSFTPPSPPPSLPPSSRFQP
jgi:hypothetical protein